MKKNLLYLFALICSVSLFTACSDDDEKQMTVGKLFLLHILQRHLS